jgi:hypothetical protein
MKSSVLWDVTPCSPLKVNLWFRRTCCLHLQCQRIGQSKNQHEASSKQSYLATCFSFSLAFFTTQKMDTTCSFKTLVGFQGLHEVISQKIRPFPHIKFWTLLRIFHGYHLGVIDGRKLKGIKGEQAYSTMLFISSFMKIHQLIKNLLKEGRNVDKMS